MVHGCYAGRMKGTLIGFAVVALLVSLALAAVRRERDGGCPAGQATVMVWDAAAGRSVSSCSADPTLRGEAR